MGEFLHKPLVIGASIVFAMALGSAARTASAEPATPKLDPDTREALEHWAGTYQYAQEHDHGRAIVKRALDDALTQIPRIFRPLVRRHLEKRDYFVTSFSIRRAGDRVAFRAQSYKVFAIATYPGVTRELTSKKGRITKVTHELRGGNFEQILENRRGKQHNFLSFLDDGNTVLAHTTFTSRYLDRPIAFDLVYNRVERQRRQPEKVRQQERPPQKVRPRVRPPARPPVIKRRPGVFRVRSWRLGDKRRAIIPARKAYRSWKRQIDDESVRPEHLPVDPPSQDVQTGSQDSPNLPEVPPDHE